MMDLLVALAQGLCIAGLAYGAYLSITYSAAKPVRKPPRQTEAWLAFPAEPKRDPEPIGSLSIQSDSGEKRRVRA